MPRCRAAPFAVSQAGCVGSHGGRSSWLRSSRTRSRSSGSGAGAPADQIELGGDRVIRPATGHASHERDRLGIGTAFRPAAPRSGTRTSV